MEASSDEQIALKALLDRHTKRAHRVSLSEDDLVKTVIRYVNAPTLGDQWRLRSQDPLPEITPTKPQLIPTTLGNKFAVFESLHSQALFAETKAELARVRADAEAGRVRGAGYTEKRVAGERSGSRETRDDVIFRSGLPVEQDARHAGDAVDGRKRQRDRIAQRWVSDVGGAVQVRWRPLSREGGKERYVSEHHAAADRKVGPRQQP